MNKSINNQDPGGTFKSSISFQPVSNTSNNSIITCNNINPDYINLKLNEFHINSLEYGRSIPIDPMPRKNSNSSHIINDSNNILILDLSTSQSTLPQSLTLSSLPSTLSPLLHQDEKDRSSKDGNRVSLLSSFTETIPLLSSNLNAQINKIHLNLPTTLLRRPKSKFENLLYATLSTEKINKLLSIIDNSNIFIFFDDDSTLEKCSKLTYSLINKFIEYINKKFSQKNKRFILLSKENSTNPTNNKNNINNNNNIPNSNTTLLFKPTCNINQESKIQKFNLALKIPPKSTNKMFIQSIKKDSIHYSPTSVKKYFSFNIPNNIETSDPILPIWLRQFTERDQSDEILIKLFNNFELLEECEINRLSSCLINKKQKNNNNLFSCNNTITDYKSSNTQIHKLYSLSYLHKQFKLKKNQNNTNNTSTNTQIIQPQPQHILTPSKTNHCNVSKLNQSVPSLVISTDFSPSHNQHEGSPYTDSSANEVLLTPSDNYEVTQGIQSFSKNRYSNILPYEHTRVKLHHSPLDEKTSNSLIDVNSDATIDNVNTRKRKNSSDLPLSNWENDDNHNNLTSEADENDSSSTSLSSSQDCSNNETETPIFLRAQKQRPSIKERRIFNDYFNANYLSIPKINADYRYVATQAPLPSTVDDFWNVVTSNNVKLIISLNSEDELELRKWDIYWNNTDNQKYEINVIKVFHDCFHLDGCILRIFQVYRKDRFKECQKYSMVYQLQYTKWLDSCSVDVEDLLNIFKVKDTLLENPLKVLHEIDTIEPIEIDQIKKLHNACHNFKNKLDPDLAPLLIHCSAGCGRTGVFIALDFLINILQDSRNSGNKIDVWNMKQDLIFIIINELRKQRLSMVQNLSQYITCYESILEYFALLKANHESIHQLGT